MRGASRGEGVRRSGAMRHGGLAARGISSPPAHACPRGHGAHPMPEGSLVRAFLDCALAAAVAHVGSRGVLTAGAQARTGSTLFR